MYILNYSLLMFGTVIAESFRISTVFGFTREPWIAEILQGFLLRVVMTLIFKSNETERIFFDCGTYIIDSTYRTLSGCGDSVFRVAIRWTEPRMKVRESSTT